MELTVLPARITESMARLDLPLLLLQLLNVALLVTWILLALLALVRLRKEQLQDAVEIVWVLIILLIPILGALAFFIVRSRRRT